jgi:hypothetical protein
MGEPPFDETGSRVRVVRDQVDDGVSAANARRAADVLLTPPPEEGAPPVIVSVTPPQAASGTKGLQVLGRGFTGATSVKVDGKEADFVAKSDTELTVDVPAGAQTGQRIVVVTNKHGVDTHDVTITER